MAVRVHIFGGDIFSAADFDSKAGKTHAVWTTFAHASLIQIIFNASQIGKQ